ncbi:MAG: CPBP family intramembrane metalloprotease [Pirellulales bacterium]|nr:CPBP family intramembrane metalloprotease [Pirellulales bacterium]
MDWSVAYEIDPRLLGVICLALALGILLVEGAGFFVFRRPRKPAIVVIRRTVPWGFGDLVLIAAVFYVGITLWSLFWRSLVPPLTNPDFSPWTESHSSLHPLLRLIRQGQWSYLIVCGISAVLAAPLAEEFFFRVFLQGWLEGLERRGRRRWRILRRRWLRGVFPVLFSALPFALLHIRGAGPTAKGEYLLFLMSGNAAASLVALGFAVFWMLAFRGATAADLGWAPRDFFRDLLRGLIVFLALVVPLYLIQAGAALLLPKDVTPDPLPLFFLAAVLGGFYYSTHRVVPLVAAHSAVNAFAFFSALWYFF